MLTRARGPVMVSRSPRRAPRAQARRAGRAPRPVVGRVATMRVLEGAQEAALARVSHIMRHPLDREFTGRQEDCRLTDPEVSQHHHRRLAEQRCEPRHEGRAAESRMAGKTFHVVRCAGLRDHRGESLRDLRVGKRRKSLRPQLHRGDGTANEDHQDLLQERCRHGTRSHLLRDEFLESPFQLVVQPVLCAEMLDDRRGKRREEIDGRPVGGPEMPADQDEMRLPWAGLVAADRARRPGLASPVKYFGRLVAVAGGVKLERHPRRQHDERMRF